MTPASAASHIGPARQTADELLKVQTVKGV
jgi:hypothetical protein